MVIDIVIGLVFIYLIYSLFVSTLSEIVATWLGMRGRMLRQGIGYLLNDYENRNWPKGIFGAVGDFFLFKKRSFSFTKAGEFYKNPAIKFLSTERSGKQYFTKKGLPAYIRKATFSSALIDMLRSKGRGIHDWEKIKFSITNNAAHFEPETKNQLNAMLQDADDDMDVFIQRIEAWYDEMMERVNGWYKRRLRFMLFCLGFIIVASFNVDTLEIVKILANNKNARTQLAEIAVAYEKRENKSTPLNGSSQLSENDTLRRQQLEAELEDIRKDIDQANELLGIGWNFNRKAEKHEITEVILNPADSLKLTKVDKEARRLNSKINTLSSVAFIDKKAIKPANDSLDALVVQIQDIFLKKDSFLWWALFNRPILSIDSIVYMGKTDFHKNCFTWHGVIAPTTSQKFGYFLSSIFPWKIKFWGLWITALALSLGAPFWFDLLKKLIAIKNVGINGDEKKKKEEDLSLRLKAGEKSGRGTTPQTNDPVEVALSNHKDNWEEIPGVIAVNKIADKGIANLQIIHTVDCDLLALNKIINASSIDQNIVSIKFISGTYGKFDTVAAPFENSVGNVGIGTWGTASGLVHNNKTNNTSLLSCGHVYNGETATNIREGLDKISLGNGTNFYEIGTLKNNMLSSYLDAGVVDIYNQYLKTLPFKPIPIIGLIGASNSKVTLKTPGGKIACKIVNKSYDYTIDKTKFFDLLRITSTDPNHPKTSKFTKDGYSGSLITNENDQPIAIHFAWAKVGSTYYSLGIRLNEIFRALDLTHL